MADISAVVKQLQKNQEKNTNQLAFLNDQIAGLNTTMNNMIKGLQRSLESLAMDNLEKSREAKRDTDKAKGQPKGGSKLPPLTSFQGLLAGIGALAAALSGLRGWETKAIANVKSIGKALKGIFAFTFIPKLAGWLIPEKFKTWASYFKIKMGNLKAGILKGLGFDLTLAKFNDPESGLKVNLWDQVKDGTNKLSSKIASIFKFSIPDDQVKELNKWKKSLTNIDLPEVEKPKIGFGQQMLNRVNLFKQNLLAGFGLGVDGKPTAGIQGPDGKFQKKELSLAAKATQAMGKILGPIKSFVTGITDFIGGAGRGLFKFIETYIMPGVKAGVAASGGAVAAVAKLMGKVLLPLGILFSAFDAFKAWQETDGTFGEKFTAASFAFLGDFIGAPIDLLKSGVSWIFKKIFGDENFISEFLDSFSIEEAIKGIPQAIMKVFDGVMAFFRDPVGVATDVFTKIKDMIVDSFMWLVQKAIGKVAGLIPGMSSLLPDWAISPEEKALASLKDERTMNENQSLGLQFDQDALTRRNNMAKRSMDASAKEIADIENIIATGDYAGWLSDKFGGIGDEEEARAKIADLKIKQAEAEKEFEETGRGLMATSRTLQTLNVKNAELTESIEELRKAIDDGTASSLIIQDNSTNTGGSNSQSNQIIDTSGTNDTDDQYSVVPVG